jgi:hypothetical protein
MLIVFVFVAIAGPGRFALGALVPLLKGKWFQ